MLLPSPAELEAILGCQRGAGPAAVTPYRTSWDKGHLSNVNLTHLELSHLPASDAHFWGTRGQKVKHQPWQQILFPARLILM